VFDSFHILPSWIIYIFRDYPYTMEDWLEHENINISRQIYSVFCYFFTAIMYMQYII